MFDRIFGKYLVEQGELTDDQLHLIFAEQDNKRVRLGVIAVSEKMMTITQVEEVNHYQAIMDKRFGDIAIEKGYLTQDQVKHLLCLQSNTFLVFIQSILDKDYLTMDEIENYLSKYQNQNGFTLTDMEALKSCDIDRIVPIFFFEESRECKILIGILLRTTYRLIDFRAFLSPQRKVDRLDATLLSSQRFHGDSAIFTAIACDEEAMMRLAISFAGADLIEEKEDSLDAMCEFLNCVNGLFATQMSNENINIDMLSPEYTTSSCSISGKSFIVIPLHMRGVNVDYVIAYDSEVTITN